MEQGREPDPEQIRNVAPSVGWKNIRFENGIFTKSHDLTALDLGGVVKGYCVDLLLEKINKAGYKDVYVEWGGEIRTSGLHPENRPWKIYIRAPDTSDPAQALSYHFLRDQAIATSGDYHQYWTIRKPNGETITYFHIINPKTLSPLERKKGSVAGASIIAKECVTADALAKVLMFFDSPAAAEEWFQNVQKIMPHLSAELCIG